MKRVGGGGGRGRKEEGEKRERRGKKRGREEGMREGCDKDATLVFARMGRFGFYSGNTKQKY